MSTDPCLPRAHETSYTKIGWVILIWIICLVTCFMDSYISRWRPSICNLYYKVRARERCLALYQRIKAGRKQRKFQLKAVVGREVERRTRMKEFVTTKFRAFFKR